ncbi:unnamed protein product [Gadus morhua 'NCC']
MADIPSPYLLARALVTTCCRRTDPHGHHLADAINWESSLRNMYAQTSSYPDQYGPDQYGPDQYARQ